MFVIIPNMRIGKSWSALLALEQLANSDTIRDKYHDKKAHLILCGDLFDRFSVSPIFFMKASEVFKSFGQVFKKITVVPGPSDSRQQSTGGFISVFGALTLNGATNPFGADVELDIVDKQTVLGSGLDALVVVPHGVKPEFKKPSADPVILSTSVIRTNDFVYNAYVTGGQSTNENLQWTGTVLQHTPDDLYVDSGWLESTGAAKPLTFVHNDTSPPMFVHLAVNNGMICDLNAIKYVSSNRKLLSSVQNIVINVDSATKPSTLDKLRGVLNTINGNVTIVGGVESVEDKSEEAIEPETRTSALDTLLNLLDTQEACDLATEIYNEAFK